MLHAVRSLRDLYTKPDIDMHAMRPLPYTDVPPGFPPTQAPSTAPAPAAQPARTPVVSQRVDSQEPLPDLVPVLLSPQLRPATPHRAPRASPQRVTSPALTSTTSVPTYTWIRVHQRHVKGAPLAHFEHVGWLVTDSDGTYRIIAIDENGRRTTGAGRNTLFYKYYNINEHMTPPPMTMTTSTLHAQSSSEIAQTRGSLKPRQAQHSWRPSLISPRSRPCRASTRSNGP
jgi:hypothetical protein